MGKIKVSSCETDGMVIEGLHVIEPTVFNDERGYFMETYNQNDFKEAGLNMVFVQDNQSMSVKGVLRGLHFQKQFPQGKLVRAVRGTVFDVAVDLRTHSKTYGKWSEFAYKCTDFYHPGDEGGLAWNDETIGVKWPITPDMKLIISEKDQKWPGFKEIFKFDR